MTWFKVDDSFYDHPKVFDAPDCAVALWIRAGTWSARNLTEGFVPSGLPARLCDDHDTAVKELVRRGLWTRASGGYRFHDWSTYQPSKESVEDLRSKRAAAGRLGGRAKAARRGTGVEDPRLAGSTRSGNSSQGAPDPRMRNDAGEHALQGGPDRISAGPDEMAKQNASKRLASASPVAKQTATPTRPEGSVVQLVPRGKAVTRERASPPEQPEPARRCPRHIDDPEPPSCGACADARRGHERWQVAEAERQRTWRKCRTHPGQPAHNCGLCRADRLAADQESR